MTGLVRVADELQSFFIGQGWSFCFIGGLAVQHWGEPRFTSDVDLTLLTGFGEEERYVDVLLREFAPRHAEARDIALQHRVVLLESKNQIGIDIALGGLPFEESAVERGQKIEFAPGIFLKICAAEDLIVMKCFAGRSLDWHDLSTILIRQKGKIDWNYVENYLRPLLTAKEQMENWDRLLQIRDGEEMY